MYKYHAATMKLVFQIILAAVLFYVGVLLIADGVQLLGLEVNPLIDPQGKAK